MTGLDPALRVPSGKFRSRIDVERPAQVNKVHRAVAVDRVPKHHQGASTKRLADHSRFRPVDALLKGPIEHPVDGLSWLPR